MMDAVSGTKAALLFTVASSHCCSMPGARMNGSCRQSHLALYCSYRDTARAVAQYITTGINARLLRKASRWSLPTTVLLSCTAYLGLLAVQCTAAT